MLRPMIQDIPDTEWMLRQEFDPVFEAMIDHGLVFDALVKPQHLPHLLELVHRHPDLRVVIDHAAKPHIAGHVRDSSAFQEWRSNMKRLAQESRAFVKLSGLVTEASTYDNGYVYGQLSDPNRVISAQVGLGVVSLEDLGLKLTETCPKFGLILIHF